ncbi:low temperature requirement protein A [Agilicoccus flavus]|uniref:low temperature requirement protein A n=1 Tax=Agilicoccus flavus TaxID=2775968 RepID=UPI001CF66F96|nr:low temperature requirement protein A [Agilicoccus flavus]
MTAAAARTSALVVGLAQLGWVALIPLHPPVAVWLPAYLVLFALEVGGPWAVDRTHGRLPWHAHHIAERYGLLVIIALGEGVVGTVVSTQSLIQTQGWSVAAAVLAVGGVTLTMGMWWIYFAAPFGWLLERRPGRALSFTYAHIPLLAAVAGVGAGLHVAAYDAEGVGHLTPALVVATTAAPVAVFWLSALWLYHHLVPGRDRVHVVGSLGVALGLAGGIVLAAAGVPVAYALAVVVLAPWVNVVGYETVGHRAVTDNLRRVAAGSPGSDAHG